VIAARTSVQLSLGTLRRDCPTLIPLIGPGPRPTTAENFEPWRLMNGKRGLSLKVAQTLSRFGRENVNWADLNPF
jgi:hypothetical protein